MGILTLLGDEEKREEILGGRKKWGGRIVERETEIEAKGLVVVVVVMATCFWASG